jgi:molybdopterin-guanine dinucleotide biosynthesis protein A
LIRRHREHPPRRDHDPVGVVLAGGLGHRIGGAKAVVELNRRPLISYPIDAIWRAIGNVAIVAKIDTKLPSVSGVSVWIEPDEPRHPLVGIVYALGLAEGRPVLVCAADMPFVTPEVIERIARADPGNGCVVVASGQGELQPLLGCYHAGALAPLTRALSGSPGAMREVVEALDPMRYEVADPDVLFNINSPSDLLQAAAMLDRRRASRT